MITAWIVYAMLASALVAVAALGIEPAAKAVGLPTRFVWLGAMLVTVGLAAVAPSRGDGPAETPLPPATTATLTSTGFNTPAAERLLPSSMPALVGDALDGMLATVPVVGDREGTAIALVWLAMSALLLTLAIRTVRRYRSRLAEWPLYRVEGEPVRVSPTVGPAVLGMPRPEIVVPAWLLAAPPETQRLVVLHEREHLRAHDPLMIAVGGACLLLMPWSPPLWWMLHRLRLAVEIDCDRRVLRTGTSIRRYGSALIDVAARGVTLSPWVPALTRSRSSLERRLLAMDTKVTRGTIARLVVALPIAALALLAACESQLPSAAEVDAMDVSSLEGRLDDLYGVSSFATDSTRFYLDGESVTGERARAVPAETIAEITVKRGGGGDASEVRITTRPAQLTGEVSTPSDSAPAGQVEFRSAASQDEVSDQVALRAVGPAEAGEPTEASTVVLIPPGTPSPSALEEVVVVGYGEQPLFVIDGQVAEATDFNALDPRSIEQISVAKSGAVPAAYADHPRAEAGVILVTTKGANQ